MLLSLEPTKTTQCIYVMHHGERSDLLDQPYSGTRPYDPELSENGIKHANLVGQSFVDVELGVIGLCVHINLSINVKHEALAEFM